MSIKRVGRRTPRHVFPSPPLKFRTVGFPQYGFKLDVRRDLRHLPPYTRPKPGSSFTRHHAELACGPIGHVSDASPLAVQSRGPSLGRGFCCPTASNATMASSEPLGASCRLMDSVDRSLLRGQPRVVPHFTPRVFANVPPSVPRRTERLQEAVSSPLIQAFTISALARHPHFRTHRFPCGCVSRLQRSLHATAR